MIRALLVVGVLALLAAVGAPGPGEARQGDAAHASSRSQRAQDDSSDERKEWREKLFPAHQALALAKKRNETAQRAYQSMRHRRHPRGEGKKAVLDELALSTEELAAARQNLEDLEQAARRAGAPPSWLEFDSSAIEASVAVPASQKP